MYATDEWIAERAGVHRATVRRWRASRKFPLALERLAAIELEGELGMIHKGWHGWRLTAAGQLVSPDGEHYTPGVILALALRIQQSHERERIARAPRRGPLAAGFSKIRGMLGLGAEGDRVA